MNNTNNEVTVLESQQKPVGANNGEYGTGDGLKTEGVRRPRQTAPMLVTDELGELVTLALPFRFHSGDLGLNDSPNPRIVIEDKNGRRLLVHSLEWLLSSIDLFADGDNKASLLASLARHYGLDTFALMGRERAESKGKTWYAQRGAV